MSKKNKLYTQSKNPDIPKSIPTHSNGIPIFVWPECVVLYKYVSWETFEIIIDKWALKACMAYEANDPFEYTPQAKDEFSPVDLSARAAKGSPPPFISFSRNITSAALWGHYADSGKGVCLVFCFPCKKFSEELKILQFIDAKEAKDLSSIKLPLSTANIAKVNYQNERVPFPPTEKDADMISWYNSLITTKGKAWEFEEEYRLISNYQVADIASDGMLLYSWPMAFLLGVVTGPLCQYSPQYVKKRLSDKRRELKAVNYYLDNYYIFDNKLIVTPAKYHWKNYEIEAPPWFDRLHNMCALDSYLHYIAMLNNKHVPTIDIGNDSLSNEPLIKSWNDFMKTIDRDKNIVTMIAKKGPKNDSIDIDKSSYIYNLMRTEKARKNEE
ncbi:MAG: DUF2971 domain-containing protein [Bacteroidales bacterium]|nr:DUF2971 domain-containing protein [Candidatus Colimorpha merdihippi]